MTEVLYIMENNLPKRLYTGTVNIAGHDLGCAVLDDKTSIRHFK